MSNELRRILIDNGGDLEKVAAPRIGKVMLRMPDNGPHYRAGWATHVGFFGSAGINIFGVDIRAATMFLGTTKMPPLPGFHPSKMVEATCDQFMSQSVLCLNNKWASRREAIRYIAHVSHGVHSGTAKEENEKLLGEIRVAAFYAQPYKDKPSMRLDIAFARITTGKPSPKFKFLPGAIDPVLVELLATARFLSESPKILELEAAIKAEIEAT